MKMLKKIIVVSLITLVLSLLWASPVLAALNSNASHVARCATGMGGQHVAQCAQMMDRGVSACATGEHTHSPG